MIATVIICAALAAVVVTIIVKLVRDKRKGKCPGCSCGCGGDGCPLD